MQSPSTQQKQKQKPKQQQHQETTTRTPTTAATTIETTAFTDGRNDSSEVGSSNRYTTSSSKSLSAGESSETLWDPKEIEVAGVVGGEAEAEAEAAVGKEEEEREGELRPRRRGGGGGRRNIINEEVTSISNDNNKSSCSSSVQVGQQRDISRSIPHSSSQIAETSLRHALELVPRASVGVVVVEVDSNNKIGSEAAAEVAELTASSSANSQLHSSNQDHSIVTTSSQLKQRSNELPLSLPCNSTITDPNRHQLDQSVSLNERKLDQRIKVTLSAPRSLSDQQQIEPILFDSTTTIPASASSSTLSSNLVANSNSNNNVRKRRQSTATLISASGCDRVPVLTTTTVCLESDPNSFRQQEQQLAREEETEFPQQTVGHQSQQQQLQPQLQLQLQTQPQPQPKLKEQVEAGLRRIASQRISRNQNSTLQTTFSKQQQQPVQVKVERPSQDINIAELKQDLNKPIQLVNQQQRQSNLPQPDRNNLSINQNNPKQLAIYINGKIRSNSIFCQSSSANSFSSILNRFHGSGSNTNSATSANSTTRLGEQEHSREQQQQELGVLNQADCGAGEFVATNKKQRSLCLRLKRNYFKWNVNQVNQQQQQQHKQSGRARNKVFNLSSSAKRYLNNQFLHGGDDDENASLTNQNKRGSSVSQKTPLCQASSLPTASPLIRKTSDNTNQTNKAKPQVAAETKVIIEGDPSESCRQQQQPSKASYKLNPSSMFLRKAMRYYRLWIYCTNITILLGTLIFILSTIYVMSDYRFKLLVSQSQVRQGMHVENINNNHEQMATISNQNGKQQAIDEADNSTSSSADLKEPSIESSLPLNDSKSSASFNNGNLNSDGGATDANGSGSSEKDFDIHIKYSEPSVIIAYAVIVIQAGVLQAIGCFGAIRMKERWIQAFWYMILGLTVFDVVFLLYWLNRYDLIVNSLQRHMKFRLREHYGSFVETTLYPTNQQFESSTGIYLNLALTQNPSTIDTLLESDIGLVSSSRSPLSSSSSVAPSYTGGSSIVPTNELYSQMDKILTEIIDKIQIDSQCCGISNSLDYKRSKWRQIKLDQLRVRLNWTAEAEAAAMFAEKAPVIQGTASASARDKRISDLNVATNLLRRVPLVPASCCKSARRTNKYGSTIRGIKTNNRRDNWPMVLDDSQLDRAPRVPAWSPSMVVENLQDSTANVRRKSKLAATATKIAKEEFDPDLTDPNDNDDEDGGGGGDKDSSEEEEKGGRGDNHVIWQESSSGIKMNNQKKRVKNEYYLDNTYNREKGNNDLPPNDELSLVDMLDRRWAVHNPEPEELDQNRKIPTAELQTDDDSYDNLNNHQRRLVSKQENFNYPPSGAAASLDDETNNEDDSVDRRSERKRRWLVESRVDDSEQVLSRYIEGLKDSNGRTADETLSGYEQIDGTSRIAQLKALRHLLFRQVSCNLPENETFGDTRHHGLKFNNNGACFGDFTSEDNFKWPNKLQLSFNQYKVLENYLTLADNETNSGHNMFDEVDPTDSYDNESIGGTKLNNNFSSDSYQLEGETNRSKVRNYGRQSNGTNQVEERTGTAQLLERRLLTESKKDSRGNRKWVKRRKRKRNIDVEQSAEQLADDKEAAAAEIKRRRLELAEALRSDPDTSCAPRSYFDQATIYTHGCQPVIKSWLDSSAHILFVTGFCVLTVLKFCSVVLLRLEIQEMIHKIRVLKGMATEYNALHDLEAYLPRPSICAQAAELTASGVTAALAASPTTNQSSGCCIGGAGISCSSTIAQQQQSQQSQSQPQSQQQQQQQQQPPIVAPARSGGSFSEAVVAAATAAAASQQQLHHQHSVSNQPSINLFGQLGFGLGTGGIGSVGRATSMKAMTVGMSNMLTPDLCPRSSSASSAHLQATTFLASQKHALSLRSDLFQSPSSVMSRRHTAVSVCPAAAAAAAAAAHHLMSRRGTYVANPVFNAAPLINPGINLNQHRHSAHTLGCSSSLLKPPLRQQLSGPKSSQGCYHLTGADSTQINDSPTSGLNYNQSAAAMKFDHQSSVESSAQQRKHSGQSYITQQQRQRSNQNRGSQQLLSLVYPFKRQSSAQSACNFPLDLSPPMITESRRSIH